MTKDHGPSVKDDEKYEALRDEVGANVPFL